MFEEFMGLPAHPLIIHAPVVFVPLLAVLAVAYAFVPFIRPHTRWVLAVLAVVTPISALLAKLSGDAFFDRGLENGYITEGFVPRVEDHQQLGTTTVYLTIGLGVLTLALVYLIAPRGGRSRAGANLPAWVLPLVLGGLTTIVAIASLVYIFRTGDSGAQMVWENR